MWWRSIWLLLLMLSLPVQVSAQYRTTTLATFGGWRVDQNISAATGYTDCLVYYGQERTDTQSFLMLSLSPEYGTGSFGIWLGNVRNDFLPLDIRTTATVDGVPVAISGTNQEAPGVYDLFRIERVSALFTGNILSLAVGFNNSPILLELDVPLQGLGEAYELASTSPNCRR
jgi:hypothetical protein